MSSAPPPMSRHADHRSSRFNGTSGGVSLLPLRVHAARNTAGSTLNRTVRTDPSQKTKFTTAGWEEPKRNPLAVAEPRFGSLVSGAGVFQLPLTSRAPRMMSPVFAPGPAHDS